MPKSVRSQRSKRNYSAEKKRKAVHDIRELGVTAAARKHHLPKSTAYGWQAQVIKNERPVHGSASRRETKSRTKVKNQHGPAPGNAASRAVASSDRVCAAADAETCVSEPSASTSPTATEKVLKRGVARRYTPSERASILEYAAEHSVTEAANHFGTTRFSIYAWQRKVEKAAKGKGDSPTSGPEPTAVESQRDAEILGEWKQQPGLGPSQIRNQLRRKGVKVSVHTARRVMEDAGYRPPKVRREPHNQFYESVRPNQMWHLDFVQKNINRANTFTLILIDDHSRFVVGHGVDDAERADIVLETFEQAVRLHGRPESVMHDKGSAFWSWRGISRFTALLTELGVDQVVAEHKEWNGKVEVFNANLHKELFDCHRFYDLAEMKRRLRTHISWYNHARTHHALGGLLVPADRYYGRAEDVLARIEAGSGREEDVLALRDRGLELFKIISKNGRPEVWLLGQLILSGDAQKIS